MTRGFLYSIYLNLSQRIPQLHGQGLLIQQGALGGQFGDRAQQAGQDFRGVEFHNYANLQFLD